MIGFVQPEVTCEVLVAAPGSIHLIATTKEGRPGETRPHPMTTVGKTSSCIRVHLWAVVLRNILGWAGIIILLMSITANYVMMYAWNRSFIQQIREELLLGRNSSFQGVNSQENFDLSVYMFGIMDKDNSTTTVFEHEPAVYRQQVRKVNVTWLSNNSISYQEHYSLFFDPHRSVGPDVSGYSWCGIVSNGSLSPFLNVLTDEFTLGDLGQTYTWNFLRYLPYWGSQDANRVSGSDGSVFPPYLDHTSTPTMFYPLLLRKFDLHFSKSSSREDLPLLVFTVADSQFSNDSLQSGHSRDTQDDSSSTARQTRSDNGDCMPKCVPSGLYHYRAMSDTGLPDPDSNFYISLPHLLGVDPNYRQLIRGLQPDERRHRPIFEVDQVTGVTVRQRRRFQVNMRQIDDKVSFVPMYWFELSQEISDDVLDKLRTGHAALRNMTAMFTCVGLALIASLLACLGVLVYRIIRQRQRPNPYYPLVGQETNWTSSPGG